MPRSIWNGTITLGLIAVPVKAHSATEDHSVHFHQVHAKDGARIRQHRICAKEGREVPYEEVAKGYEISEGEYVLLAPEEIAAAAGEGSHRIGLEEFVCATDIDPVFYEKTYYLSAGKDGEDAYRLLHDALSASERAGIGRWVFHNREYLVSVRALGGVLALHTMRFADELVAAEDLELAEPDRAPGKRELDMAKALVDSLEAEFDPSRFEDAYRARVLELIDRKAKGEEIEIPEPPEADETPDLLAALEASLGKGARKPAGKSKRGSKSTGSSGAKRGSRSTASSGAKRGSKSTGSSGAKRGA